MLPGAAAACAEQSDMLSYFLHEAFESVAVLLKIVSANNRCFTRGFWKFMSVITRLLITSKTTKLCLVLGSESCWVEMGFSTNWLIMKSTQILENEIDPRLYNPQPVLHVQLTDLWVRKCVRAVHLWHCLRREQGRSNPNAHVCLSLTEALHRHWCNYMTTCGHRAQRSKTLGFSSSRQPRMFFLLTSKHSYVRLFESTAMTSPHTIIT